MEDEPALRQHSEVSTVPIAQEVCLEKIGVSAGVNPMAAVNSGKVSIQEDGEVSQRTAFSHIPTLAPLSFVFLPIHLGSEHRCWPRRDGVPKAYVLFAALVWLGFPVGGMAEQGGEEVIPSPRSHRLSVQAPRAVSHGAYVPHRPAIAALYLFAKIALWMRAL